MNPTKVPEGHKDEVANLADAANRILKNKARIKARTQAFAREVKLQQSMTKGSGHQ